MLIRSKDGRRILRTDYVTLVDTSITAHNPKALEWIKCAVYETCEEAETAMQFVWHVLAQDDLRAVIDLMWPVKDMKRIMRHNDRPR